MNCTDTLRQVLGYCKAAELKNLALTNRRLSHQALVEGTVRPRCESCGAVANFTLDCEQESEAGRRCGRINCWDCSRWMGVTDKNGDNFDTFYACRYGHGRGAATYLF